jgi:hypothetical protein
MKYFFPLWAPSVKYRLFLTPYLLSNTNQIIMLHNISWKVFLTMISVMTSLYWIVVIMVSYKSTILMWATNSGSKLGILNDGLRIKKVQIEYNDFGKLFPELHRIVTEIKSVVESSARKNSPKEELMMALQIKQNANKSYTGVSSSISVNYFLQEVCNDYCSFQLNKDNLNILLGS